MTEHSPMSPLTLAERIEVIEQAYELMLAYAAQGRQDDRDDSSSIGVSCNAQTPPWTVWRRACVKAWRQEPKSMPILSQSSNRTRGPRAPHCASSWRSRR